MDVDAAPKSDTTGEASEFRMLNAGDHQRVGRRSHGVIRGAGDASMVELVMKGTPKASELQAIEEVAEMGVVLASSFAGAVQKTKRMVYIRRPL